MGNVIVNFDVFDLIVDETAATGFNQYVEQQPEGKAVDSLMTFHRKHIAATTDAAAANGGLFLTDIPDADLTVLEVRLGAKVSIGLYSRNEASQVAGLILEILGAQAETHH